MENTIFMRPHFGIANGLCNQLAFVINSNYMLQNIIKSMLY